jgi:ketosteroid isomerase-like protein
MHPYSIEHSVAVSELIMDSNTQAFLAQAMPRQQAAEQSIRAGDVAPRLAMWSQRDPVSWLGQFGTCAVGAAEVAGHFARVAPRLSDFDEVTFEVIAAEAFADCAYLVGYEHSMGRIDGGPRVATTYRISRLYRREGGEWRTAHGHADIEPATLQLPWHPPVRTQGGEHDH